MRFVGTLLCLWLCGCDRSTTSMPVSVMLVAFVVGVIERSADDALYTTPWSAVSAVSAGNLCHGG